MYACGVVMCVLECDGVRGVWGCWVDGMGWSIPLAWLVGWPYLVVKLDDVALAPVLRQRDVLDEGERRSGRGGGGGGGGGVVGGEEGEGRLLVWWWWGGCEVSGWMDG